MQVEYEVSPGVFFTLKIPERVPSLHDRLGLAQCVTGIRGLKINGRAMPYSFENTVALLRSEPNLAPFIQSTVRKMSADLVYYTETFHGDIKL